MAGLVGLGLIAIWQGFVPPPHASTLIRIRDGAVHVRRGQVRADAREHISDVLRDAGVSRGFIAITPGNWVAFSRRIPRGVSSALAQYFAQPMGLAFAMIDRRRKTVLKPTPSLRRKCCRLHPAWRGSGSEPSGGSIRLGIFVLFFIAAAMFSGCRGRSQLADRVKAAGGVDALKAECLQFVVTYEQSGGRKFTFFPVQTNYPPTIAALAPRTVQVGQQDDILLVHLGFVTGPHPFGIYVAPKGCPKSFVPRRPLGSRISKLGDGVFEYAE